jgi:prepilin-type N-terminal cleavage/methylation domain-containing protein
MKHASSPRRPNRNGFSLLEVTVVIAVLLSLTSVLFVGARAWKNGADRTACILNIRNVQQSVRSYQDIYGYTPGGMPYAENGTQDIAAHMYAKGYITTLQMSAIQGGDTCPGGGSYLRSHPDVFPPVGRLYLECSLSASDNHSPEDNLEW